MVPKISRKMIFFLIKSRKATDCVRGVRQFIVPVARREGETYRASFRTGPWNPSGDSTIDGGDGKHPLREQGWHRDAVERQLAHAERDSIRAAYNYAQHMPERRRMMRAWADYLED